MTKLRREAEEFIRDEPELIARLERVASLIDGYSTPFGMELLGTVHWIMTHQPEAKSPEAVLGAIAHWSKRKAAVMSVEHIAKAQQRLREQGWVRS